MPNEKNLIPFNERTENERREIAKKGGIASGIARRRKKKLKESVDLYFSMPESDRKRWKEIAKMGLSSEDIDNQMAIIVGLGEMAKNGDARSAKVLFDLLGEDAREDSDGGVVIVDDIS